MSKQAPQKRPVGRPRGSATRKTREIAEKAIKEGITPLEVMVNTMRALWRAAEAIEDVAEATKGKVAACAIAEKAAPYMHPKLSSIEASVRRVRSVEDLSDEELAALAVESGAAGATEPSDGEGKPARLH